MQSPRWLMVRVVIWLAVLGWAVWLLRSPMPHNELAAPASHPAAAGNDPSQVLVALQAVTTAGCGGTGTVHVRVGSAGLEKAWIEPGAADTACLEKAVWSQSWPALSIPLEMEMAL